MMRSDGTYSRRFCLPQNIILLRRNRGRGGTVHSPDQRINPVVVHSIDVEPAPAMGRVVSPEMLLAALLFVLLSLPFVAKAFHIDDNVFLDISRIIGWNPLDAVPVDYDYKGRILSKFLPYEMTHPLLVPYYMKIVTALFGEQEIPLHLAFLVFPLCTLLGAMGLNAVMFPGSRNSQLLLPLCLCSLPTFMVNAQNLMADVPTLAFLLLAMTGFFHGFQDRSRTMILIGGVCLSLSALSSYQILAFIPLILGYALWQRRLDRTTAAALALPLLVLFSWLMLVYARYDIFPFLKSNPARLAADNAFHYGTGMKNLADKTISLLGFIGSSLMWILPLYYILKKAVRKFILFYVPLVIVSHLGVYGFIGFGFNRRLLFTALLAMGMLAIITLVQAVRERRTSEGIPEHDLFLLVWFFTVLGYILLLFPFSAARYLLPAFPPALMILLNDPAWHVSSRMQRVGIGAVLGCALLFSLASAHIDYRLAESYRNIADRTGSIRSRAGQGTDIWYIGQWGMQYYMDRAGARYLYAGSDAPKAGDYVIVPQVAKLWSVSPALQERLVVVSTEAYDSPLPLRLFNNRSRAGFYAHFWGMLPFAFSAEPLEVFTIYRVAAKKRATGASPSL